MYSSNHLVTVLIPVFNGEKYIIDNAKDYLICRAGWMMGGRPKKDKKFIQKIMKQINAGKKEPHIVNDKLGTHTYTHDFVANVKLLIDNGERGLFNMVCEGLTSRLDVAYEIEIKEVDSNYFAKEYFEPVTKDGVQKFFMLN